MPANGKVAKTTSRNKRGASKDPKIQAAMEVTASHAAQSQKDEAPQSPPGSPVYFWRETHPNTGYLSQWYQCPFTDAEGTVYKTAEQ
jgi:hypothetical protein